MRMHKAHAAWNRVHGPVVAAGLQRGGVVLTGRVRFVGVPIVDLADRNSITIGEGSTLISHPRWTALGVSRPVILRTLLPGATITIGSEVGMSGTTICAAASITIGDRVLFGADVIVADTDFHPIDEVPRRWLPIPGPSAGDEVTIGDDAFLGTRAVVLKGSSIGSGAVVGAGSVVAGDVPAGAVVAGNPAKFIRWVHGFGASQEVE